MALSLQTTVGSIDLTLWAFQTMALISMTCCTSVITGPAPSSWNWLGHTSKSMGEDGVHSNDAFLYVFFCKSSGLCSSPWNDECKPALTTPITVPFALYSVCPWKAGGHTVLGLGSQKDLPWVVNPYYHWCARTCCIIFRHQLCFIVPQNYCNLSKRDQNLGLSKWW